MKKWDTEATRELLRFGRKHDGPWNETSSDIPDDDDADLVCTAPDLLEECEDVLAEYLAEAFCHGKDSEELRKELIESLDIDAIRDCMLGCTHEKEAVSLCRTIRKAKGLGE